MTDRLLPWVMACFAFDAVFLGGSTDRWAKAFLLVELGVLLLVAPPRASLGWKINALLLALPGWASLAFLPHGWMPEQAWKSRLRPYFDDVLASTHAPEPWLSAESLVMLCLGIAWFYWVASAHASSRSRRLTAVLFTWGMVAIAVLSLCFHFYGHTPAFWNSDRNFGPFGNRNHTATVLGLATMLAVVFALKATDRFKGNFWAYCLSLLVLLPSLYLNYSRAGILLPILGLTLWIAILFAANRSSKLLALGLSGIILAFVLFALFGGIVAERFALPDSISIASLLGYRGLIFKDAWHLGMLSPVTGHGIGSFEPLIALYREASLTPSNRLAHPESDWLWLFTEMGGIGVLLVAALIFFSLKKHFPIVRRQGWRVEAALLAAGGAFFLHSLVDPAGHCLGSMIPGLLLAGLLVNRTMPHHTGRWPVWTFRGAGVVFVVVGGTWLAEETGFLKTSGSLAVEQAKAQTQEAIKAGDFPAAIQRASGGIALAPLSWQLYFRRAVAQTASPQNWLLASTDFERVRALQPARADLSVSEGNVWLDQVPAFATQAWTKALEQNPETVVYNFRQVISRPNNPPKLLARLQQFAQSNPALRLAWMEHALPTEFSSELELLLEQDPQLETLDSDQRKKLFALWARNDRSGTMAETIQNHPTWMNIAWPWVARDLQKAGQSEAACRLALRFIVPPPLPPATPAESLDKLRSLYFADRKNPALIYRLAVAEGAFGTLSNALHILKTASQNPESPEYLSYVEAQVAVRMSDWPAAWTALTRYAHL